MPLTWQALREAQPIPNVPVSGSCVCLARNAPELGILLAPSPLASECLGTHAAAIWQMCVLETLAFSRLCDGPQEIQCAKMKAQGHVCPQGAWSPAVVLVLGSWSQEEALEQTPPSPRSCTCKQSLGPLPCQAPRGAPWVTTGGGMFTDEYEVLLVSPWGSGGSFPELLTLELTGQRLSEPHMYDDISL